MKITTRLRAKIHVYDALGILIEYALCGPSDWLGTHHSGQDLTIDEWALVQEVASNLRAEMLRRRDKAKAKIKPKKPNGARHKDGHMFLSQGKCACGFEVGDKPNGPCPDSALR